MARGRSSRSTKKTRSSTTAIATSHPDKENDPPVVNHDITMPEDGENSSMAVDEAVPASASHAEAGSIPTSAARLTVPRPVPRPLNAITRSDYDDLTDIESDGENSTTIRNLLIATLLPIAGAVPAAPVVDDTAEIPIIQSNGQSIAKSAARSTTKRTAKSTGRSKSTKSKAKSNAKAPLRSTAQINPTPATEIRKILSTLLVPALLIPSSLPFRSFF